MCDEYRKAYGEPFKVDKNGTEYYYDWVCPRCGGAGGSDSWKYTGWTCYSCGGTGKRHTPKIVKKYTAEHQAKLDALRVKRNEKRIAEAKAKAVEDNQKFFKRNGFNEQGITYVFLGNTYEIKDQLKELGAKFNGLLGWHIDHEVENYPTIEVSVDEVYYKDYADAYMEGYWRSASSEDFKAFQQKIEQANKGLEVESTFVGNVGDKLDLEVTYLGYASWKNIYGTTYLHKFQDADNNTLVWKTTNYLYDIQKGQQVLLKGKVKGHDVYNDEKQTTLTRCTVKLVS